MNIYLLVRKKSAIFLRTQDAGSSVLFRIIEFFLASLIPYFPFMHFSNNVVRSIRASEVTVTAALSYIPSDAFQCEYCPAFFEHMKAKDKHLAKHHVEKLQEISALTNTSELNENKDSIVT